MEKLVAKRSMNEFGGFITQSKGISQGFKLQIKGKVFEGHFIKNYNDGSCKSCFLI